MGQSQCWCLFFIFPIGIFFFEKKFYLDQCLEANKRWTGKLWGAGWWFVLMSHGEKLVRHISKGCHIFVGVQYISIYIYILCDL